MSDRKFLFLLGSSRSGGNTETLARLAAEQLPDSVEQRWLHLEDLPLGPFRDVRHAEGPAPAAALTGHAATLLEATLEATDLVIASPVYWYSVSSSTKLYLDHWEYWLNEPDVDFKERMKGHTLWGVTALAGRDRADADPLVGTLRISARYLAMNWGGALVGNGSKPGDVLNDSDATARAKTFFDLG
ncbi:flavodoxin family protein [Streptomyces sp. NPDC050504]|uniref:flavodoxin family protein n=1 Tax=Streptomyces sp. NPDC050504 TaxID=3365618 RepID=UPI00378E7292